MQARASSARKRITGRLWRKRASVAGPCAVPGSDSEIFHRVPSGREFSSAPSFAHAADNGAASAAPLVKLGQDWQSRSERNAQAGTPSLHGVRVRRAMHLTQHAHPDSRSVSRKARVARDVWASKRKSQPNAFGHPELLRRSQVPVARTGLPPEITATPQGSGGVHCRR